MALGRDRPGKRRRLVVFVFVRVRDMALPSRMGFSLRSAEGWGRVVFLSVGNVRIDGSWCKVGTAAYLGKEVR